MQYSCGRYPVTGISSISTFLGYVTAELSGLYSLFGWNLLLLGKSFLCLVSWSFVRSVMDGLMDSSLDITLQEISDSEDELEE